jgi:osmotically-inducible protein OsmY
MTDKELRDRVMAELKWVPSIDEAHIGVAAEKGVVTLSGHVGSYPQKYEAERVVQRVAGVAAIANEIEVRLPSHRKTADDEIARRAVDIIAYDAQIPPDSVKVRVEHGRITLSGTVEWQYQRSAAERAVSKLSGVIAVIDRIRLKPSVAPADVRQQIEKAFLRNAALAAEGVEVDVVGTTVTLRGKVRSWTERAAAETAAWAAPGVTEVVDHIALKG